MPKDNSMQLPAWADTDAMRAELARASASDVVMVTRLEAGSPVLVRRLPAANLGTSLERVSVRPGERRVLVQSHHRPNETGTYLVPAATTAQPKPSPAHAPAATSSTTPPKVDTMSASERAELQHLRGIRAAEDEKKTPGDIARQLQAILDDPDSTEDEKKKAKRALAVYEEDQEDEKKKAQRAQAKAVRSRLSPEERELLSVGARKPVAEARATRRGNVTQMPVGTSKAQARARLAELEKENV